MNYFIVGLITLALIVVLLTSYLFSITAQFEYKQEVFQTCIHNSNSKEKDAMEKCVQIVHILEKDL